MATSNLPVLQKAAVGALSSIFGGATSPMTRPLPSHLLRTPREPFAGAWQQGVEALPPTEITAYGAVYACISRIANDIAKLMLTLMEQREDGTKQLVAGTSPFWRPLRKPNHYQNRIQFIAWWLACKLMYGNAYGLKARTDANMVGKIYLIDPRLVTPLVTPTGDVYYRVKSDNLSLLPHGITVPASEMIHDRMNCLFHPLVGIAPLWACAISATQGLRIQANSQNFFKNLSRPGGILTGPDIIDQPTADRLKGEFEKNFSAQNLGRLLVAGSGLQYAPMAMPAEQAQLIEQLEWTVVDVARAFLMPAYKIGAGPIPTNNNVEALNQQYYDDCLQPYIEAIEECLTEGLAVPEGCRVEFDLTGLLRMDQTAQVKMLTEGLKGLFKPNEARSRLNLPPVTGGDTIYLQEQNFSLEALAKRDAKEDPFGKTAPAPSPGPAPAPAAPAPAPAADDEEDAEKLAADLISKFLTAEPLPL